MGVDFTITYTHQRFAALEANKTPPGEKPDGDILWPYQLKPFISHDFEKFQPPGCKDKYSGNIIIRPIRFAMDSFYRDKDRALEL